MLSVDPGIYFESHRRELMAEAERERLAALVPVRSAGVRRELALACYRLASWLDEPVQYLQRAESGREHWVALYIGGRLESARRFGHPTRSSRASF